MQIRPFDQGDITQILELLSNTYHQRFSHKWWDWKYQKNPMGHSIILVAEENKRVIGLRSFWRWNFLFSDNPMIGYQPVDTIVHEDYRSKSIFTNLTEVAIGEAKLNKADMLFNFPNRNSLPGYLKLGWHYLDSLLWWVKPVGITSCFLILFGGGTRQQCKTPRRNLFPEKTDSFLLKKIPDNLIRVYVTEDFLKWRYKLRPEIEYGISESNAGKTIFRLTQRGTCRELLIMRSNFGYGWLNDLKQIAKDNRVNYLACPAIRESETEKHLKKNGFIQTRKIINFVTLPLKSPLENIIKDQLRWDFHLELLDTF